MNLTPFQADIAKTVAVLVVFIVFRMLCIYLTKKYARKIERVEQRTNLIIKYINYATIFCIAFGIFIIWSVDLDHVESIFLSVLAL